MEAASSCGMSNHSECEELNLEATDPEWRFDPRSWERHQWLWLVSGLAAGLAVLVTLRTIYLHLRSFTNLVQQTHIVRIMIMVPVYAIDSWLSYRFFRYSVYFDLVRDAYEALVVYEFYALLVSYIGGHERAFQVFYGRLLKLPAPLCCVTVTIRHDLLKFCKLGCLQYAVLRPVVTIIAIVSHSKGTLCPGNFSPKFSYVFISGINFVSVTVAMYVSGLRIFAFFATVALINRQVCSCHVLHPWFSGVAAKETHVLSPFPLCIPRLLISKVKFRFLRLAVPSSSQSSLLFFSRFGRVLC
jgi:hypothetical protein